MYFHQRSRAITRRVNEDIGGRGSDNTCFLAAVSEDGVRALFTAEFSWFSGAKEAPSMLYLKHLKSGALEPIELSLDVEARSASRWLGVDASFETLAFVGHYLDSDKSAKNVFLHHLPSGETIDVGADCFAEAPNHELRGPLLSGDGRYLAFESEATNLVEEETYGVRQVYLMELEWVEPGGE